MQYLTKKKKEWLEVVWWFHIVCSYRPHLDGSCKPWEETNHIKHLKMVWTLNWTDYSWQFIREQRGARPLQTIYLWLTVYKTFSSIPQAFQLLKSGHAHTNGDTPEIALNMESRFLSWWLTHSILISSSSSSFCYYKFRLTDYTTRLPI